MRSKKNMSTFLNFKYVPITTQVCNIDFKHPINYRLAFHFLEVEELPVNKTYIEQKDLPFIDKPGAILSMRDPDRNFRGICKFTKDKQTGLFIQGASLRSCITLDLCTSQKNISVKLFSSKITCAGTTSPQQAMETAVLIINKLLDAQNWSDWYQAYKNQAYNVILWFKNKTDGGNNMVKNILSADIDNYWQEESKVLTKFAHYLRNITLNFQNHDVLCKILDAFTETNKICEPDNVPTILVTNNCNHNFSLNHKIIRSKLAQEFTKIPEYEVEFRNDSSSGSGVKIKIPYENSSFQIPPEIEPYIHRKNSMCYQFLVHKEGSVTFSGPHVLLNEIAYNKFMSDFYKIIHKVIVKGSYRFKVMNKDKREKHLQQLEQQYELNHTDVHGEQMIHNWRLKSLYPDEPLSKPYSTGDCETDQQMTSSDCSPESSISLNASPIDNYEY